ncbi:hypothetical protein COV04_01130 [Candidatus Uhrbacteria bacterium CG10_big_fil_rev_8_21_14_0_10_48_11]|uniref:Vitamin K epoxide reductase domain-containing protein n=1 Tax=Candidatus Uhrbacteria bacterium CG10_big_fil_rev_8_21_14_0_10_48_11 TaxID=1975037 RepID=A0A2M8LFF3_9BACT|nr:MAG: hypothetical protein COV04_01130 [Candidatus Uhrbacteria bacterium CG10_big_fil_rev_8_21_14_0_10_48_11]
MYKKVLTLQTILLAGGVFISWTTTLGQFRTFHTLYGTLFRFNDCAIPNPFVTACFYGAVAFLVAFGWSLWLSLGSENRTGERYLKNFLLFAVLFAISVLTYESLEYYKVFSFGGKIITCSPGTPLYTTPCFYGMLFFLTSYFTALVTLRFVSVKSTIDNLFS